ncbi:type II toxin-antitoxin system RelE/ParE family toxin [Craterilacuibacter sp.]|uniref:type II toxin-antitoxin system RelE/ParE family toxin n=1 Tax=Craterilacuibacter sp. TaxID=2870909 RepID=UPI003F39BF70
MNINYLLPITSDKGKNFTFFLDHVSKKLAATICKKILAYATLSQIHTSPSLKTLNSKIWGYKGTIYKLRVDCGKESARVLFMQSKENGLVLLHGFLKKTQKTPEKEARMAINNFLQVQQQTTLCRFPIERYLSAEQ